MGVDKAEIIIRAARERLDNRKSLPSPAERRALRESAGLTREEMGAILGTNAWNVVSWELGRGTPRGQMLAAYLKILRQISGTTER